MTVHAEAEGHHQWETSWAPAAVVAGIFLLVPITFSLYFQYEKGIAAAVAAGLGTPLLLAGIARWTSEGLEQKHLHTGTSPSGLGVFIVSEAFIFLALFASYWVMRLLSSEWPPEGTPHIGFLLPIVMTAILVSSSVTIHNGEAELEAGRENGFRTWLLVTLLLGLAFLACTVFEYSHLVKEGFVPDRNIYSTAFYSITGFHASHVMVGVATFIAVFIPALRGRVNRTFVACAAIYWHFVDIIWFFVVSQVYFW